MSDYRGQPDRPVWGVDPQWAGPNMPGPATGSNQPNQQQPFNYGSFNFDQGVLDAFGALKGGRAQSNRWLERAYDMGLVQNGANINADWITQMMGQFPNKPGPDADGNAQGGMKQFWRRIQEYMNTGMLPHDKNRGGGGGGGGGGQSMSTQPSTSSYAANQSVDRDPFGGELGGYIRSLINDLQGRHGLPEDVLANLYNQADATSKTRERDRLMRRGEEGASRGLFGSGLENRAMQDIEAQESTSLLNAKNDIGYANAEAAVQQINQLMGALQMASGRELGLGQLDLGYGQLGLGHEQLGVSEALGMGNLTLGQADLALQAALQEWLMNQNLYPRF